MEASPVDKSFSVSPGQKPLSSVSSSPEDHPSPQNDRVFQSEVDKKLGMESPTSQAMERSPSSYDPNRIPASVFDRNKSTNPAEWSVASNESLFSIHVGTMSFTKDQSFFQGEEMNQLGEVPTSTQTFSFSPSHSLVVESADRKSDERRTETAVETMKEVIRESEEYNTDNIVRRAQIAHISRESGSSTKSFAFQVLTGDADRGGSSVKMTGSSPKAEPQPQPRELKPEPVSSTPEATQQKPNRSKWFPCFSSCCC